MVPNNRLAVCSVPQPIPLKHLVPQKQQRLKKSDKTGDTHFQT